MRLEDLEAASPEAPSEYTLPMRTPSPHPGDDLEQIGHSTVALPPQSAHLFIDTEEKLHVFVSVVRSYSRLCIDLHGVSESSGIQHGLVTFFLPARDAGAVVDAQFLEVHLSQDGDMGWCRDCSLRGILADKTITKVFWGVRGKADFLERLLCVRIDNVVDAQLSEAVCREQEGQENVHLSSLSDSLEQLGLPDDDITAWTGVREQIQLEVLEDRPVSEQAVEYCINEIKYLPRLHQLFWGKLSEQSKFRVEWQTTDIIGAAKLQALRGSYLRHRGGPLAGRHQQVLQDEEDLWESR